MVASIGVSDLVWGDYGACHEWRLSTVLLISSWAWNHRADFVDLDLCDD